jgi:outer membrane protein assembly factor BamC
MPILIIFSGCGLKEYFPDKEQDYQFSQEIPALIIPKDLNTSIFQPKIVAVKEAETQTTSVIADFIEGTSEQSITTLPPPEKKEQPTERAKVATPLVLPKEITKQPALPEEPLEAISSNLPSTEKFEGEKKPTYVDFIMFDVGTTRLRTNEKFTPIWRLIGKALTHNEIEITTRDKVAGQFIVQYDPDRKDFTDDTISDEFLFIFSGDPDSQEKEFHIRVISHNNLLEIIVLDAMNVPLSDGAGLKLLKLIFNTLYSELSTQK